MEAFMWDEEKATADQDEANALSVAALKELLVSVNSSLPTDGNKPKLVERFVCAKHMERWIQAAGDDDDESEEEEEEEEEEAPEATLATACEGIKNLENMHKKLLKTVRKSSKGGACKFAKVTNRLSCGLCKRGGSTLVCISCRVAICTNMSCLTKHANTGKGKAWSTTNKPKLSDNQGGQSNPKKGEHLLKDGNEEGEEEEEEEEEEEDH